MGGLFALFWVFWLGMIAFVVVAIVLWVLALVEVLRYPDAVWGYAGTDKTTWILVVVLAGWIGALVYWFSQRKRLKAVESDLRARGMLNMAPPAPSGYGYGYGYGHPQGGAVPWPPPPGRSA